MADTSSSAAGILETVTNSVTSSVNSVKLAAYKAQLAQKQQELEELEASSTNVIIKYFKRIQLNNKIAELEANIAELEAE